MKKILLGIFALILLAVPAYATTFYNETAEGGSLHYTWYQGGGEVFTGYNATQVLNGTGSVGTQVVSADKVSWSFLSSNVTDSSNITFSFAIRPDGNTNRFGMSDKDACTNAVDNSIAGLYFSGNNVYYIGGGGAGVIATHTANTWETYEFLFYMNATDSKYHFSIIRNGSVLTSSASCAGAGCDDLGCIKSGGGVGIQFLDGLVVMKDDGFSAFNITFNVVDSNSTLLSNVFLEFMTSGVNSSDNPAIIWSDYFIDNATPSVVEQIRVTDLDGLYGQKLTNLSIDQTTSNFSITMDINMFFCESPLNTTAYNFFIMDEENTTHNLTSIFNAVFTLNNAVAINLSESGRWNYSICLSPADQSFQADAYIQYTSEYGFTHRFYLQNSTVSNNTQNYTIYNYNSTTGVSDLKITVRNKNNYQYFENIIATLQRYYVGEGVWRSVQMDRTGDYGLLFYNIREENTDYKIIFKDADNHILQTTESMKFVCTAGVCELTYLLDPYDGEAVSDNLTIAISFDNETSNITVTWIDPTGTSTDVTTIVTKETMTGSLELCNETITGSSGVYECDVSGHTGTMLVKVRSNDGASITDELAEWFEVRPTKIYLLLGNAEGLLWSFIICLTIVGAGAFSPVAAVISLIFGLLVVFFLGLTNIITITSLIIAVVIGLVIGFKVRS